jgi:hypothetical protein
MTMGLPHGLEAEQWMSTDRILLSPQVTVVNGWRTGLSSVVMKDNRVIRSLSLPLITTVSTLSSPIRMHMTLAKRYRHNSQKRDVGSLKRVKAFSELRVREYRRLT